MPKRLNGPPGGDPTATATEVWRSKDMECAVGGYVIHDGYIYGNHNQGYTCLDLKTGEKQWEEEGVGKGSLCWADDMLPIQRKRRSGGPFAEGYQRRTVHWRWSKPTTRQWPMPKRSSNGRRRS